MLRLFQRPASATSNLRIGGATQFDSKNKMRNRGTNPKINARHGTSLQTLPRRKAMLALQPEVNSLTMPANTIN